MTRRRRLLDGGRFPWWNHLVTARQRYTLRQGDLLAAGVTYFAFLGLFPMLLLVAGVFGLILSGHPQLEERLIAAIQDAVPGPTGDEVVAQLTQAVQVAGVTGLVGLGGALYAGMRTVGKLRIGLRQIWHGEVERPRLIRDSLADLAALGILGGLFLAGLVVTGAVSQETARVQQLLGLPDVAANGVLTWGLGIAVAMAGDVAVFLWLLRVVAAVPRRLRELLPGALFGATGLEVLKLIGGWYLTLISHSLASAAFGGAIGILVWINIVSRFAFFTAAWTATRPALQHRPTAYPPSSGERPPVSGALSVASSPR